MSHLVSVVIPAYNHKKYVAQAFQSVLEQDYQEIELIVVDDRSTDGTTEVCRKFVASRRAKARFNRIVFIEHSDNAGTHTSLNDGIAAANGRFVTFLNSDDYYARTRIGECVRAAAGQDRLVFTAVKYVDEAGDEVEPEDMVKPIQHLLNLRLDRLPSLSFGFLGHQLAISTGNMFIGRGLLERTEGFAALRYCHDWDMAMQLIRLAEPIYVAKDLYFYRYHAENAHRNLQALSQSETEYVLRHYFRAIKLGQVRNPSAPSPITWPGVFEMFAKSYGVHKWWLAESGAYPKGARVIGRDMNLPEIEM
jgi:glycosyltransferase involved in cell wall biosynthesis